MAEKGNLFDGLPDEILLEIFKENTLVNEDTHYRLLLVCKRWHAIATEAAMLWGDIVFTNVKEGTGGQQKFIVRNLVTCRSSEALVQAIKRTKTYPFQLTFLFPSPFQEESSNPHEWQLIRQAISKRCYRLTMMDLTGWDVNLIHDFAAVKRMDIHTSRNLAPIMSVLIKTSTRLRDVRIARMDSAYDILTLSPKFTSRLRSFSADTFNHIQSAFSIPPAPILEHLQLRCQAQQTQSFGLEHPMPALRSLWLTNRWSEALKPEVVPNLESLVIEVTVPFFQYDQSYEWPSLKHLEFIGSWSGALFSGAPNLDSLTLRDGDTHKFKTNAGALMGSTLRPKRVDLDIGMDSGLDEKGLSSLLQKAWEDVEDLRLVYKSEESTFGKDILAAFLGTDDHPAACQNLRKLLVLFPAPDQAQEEADGRREQAVNRLRDIVDSRRGGGALETVRFGWYDAQVDFEDAEETVDWTVILG